MRPSLVLIGPYGGAEWGEVALRVAPAAEVRLMGLVDDDFAVTARRVLSEAAGRFAVAGFCSGAPVIFELLRQAPGRLAGAAFINSTARADDARQSETRRRRIDKLRRMARADFNDEAYIAEALAWMLVNPSATVKRRAEGLLKTLEPDTALAQQTALLRRCDARDLIKDLAVPSLIIGGEGDRICPAVRSIEMAQMIAHSRLAILERCGHLAPIERPDEVATLIQEWVGRAYALV